MSIRELLFEKASSIKIQLSVLVSVEQSGPHHYFIETHDIAEQLLSWRLYNQNKSYSMTKINPTL